MYTLEVDNVHEALPNGLRLLNNYGNINDSRNGKVIVVDAPVTTCYWRPTERVLFWAERDANPFFHFFESLWMLRGRNDLAFVKSFVKRMETFSDDGISLHGAYGYRWRNWFDLEGGGHPFLPDQLSAIIVHLKDNPTSRREVLTMWDPVADLGRVGKDVPCNTHIYFWIRVEEGLPKPEGTDNKLYLDMTVCCRSNDIIWGAYGANAVHFSMLQEYIAAGIGVEVGKMWQISNNYHAYLDVYQPLYDKLKAWGEEGVYKRKGIKPYPIVSDFKTWDEDLKYFMENFSEDGQFVHKFHNDFFPEVAEPMRIAHRYFKAKQFDEAIKTMWACEATDWKLACTEWLQRRAANYKRAQDDGPTYESS